MLTEELRKASPASPLVGPLLLIALYIFLAPNVDFALSLTWHDGQRLAQVALFGLVVLLMLAVPGASPRICVAWLNLSRFVRGSLTGAFALGALSSLLSAQPRWAYLEWGMLLLLIVLALVTAAGRRDAGERADPVLVLLFYATALAYAAKTVAVYLSMLLVGPEYGVAFDARELYTGFSNIRFFGHVQTMLLPFLLLPVLWWGTTRLRRMLLWIIPVLWWMLAIGSGTRGTWIALLIGAGVACGFGNRPGRLWTAMQFRALLYGAVAYLVFILLIPELLSRPAAFLYRTDDILSLSHREILWDAAVKMAAAHPWLGIGPMHFSDTWNPVAAHPHNAVLQLMAEWGLPAALLFTLMFAVAGLKWAMRVRADTAACPDVRRSLISVALLAALTGAAAQAMVDGVLVMPVSQTLLAVLCGWALAQSAAPVTTAISRRWQLLCLAAVLFAAGAVASTVYLDAPRLEQRERAYAEMRPGGILLPRFWAQGWISE